MTSVAHSNDGNDRISRHNSYRYLGWTVMSQRQGLNRGHHPDMNRRALIMTLILISSFMVVEVVGGILTQSLALLSDAGHMFSDAAALLFSLLAISLAKKPPSAAKTYGYHRLEILAAFINGIILAVVSIYILWEALQRFQTPPQVASTGMLAVAAAGLVVNVIAALVLMRGETNHNLNMRSAFLHVIGDLFGSLGAVVAGLLMLFYQWYWADPLLSMMISLLILVSAWRVTRDSIHVLMEGTPSHISLHNLHDSLLDLTGVKEVHDLHVWTVTSGFTALSCHLVIDETADSQQLLHVAKSLLEQDYGIQHSTLQVERGRLCEKGICERHKV